MQYQTSTAVRLSLICLMRKLTAALSSKDTTIPSIKYLRSSVNLRRPLPRPVQQTCSTPSQNYWMKFKISNWMKSLMGCRYKKRGIGNVECGIPHSKFRIPHLFHPCFFGRGTLEPRRLEARLPFFLPPLPLFALVPSCLLYTSPSPRDRG